MQGRGRGRFRPGGPTARGRGRHVWPGHQQEANNRAVPEREDAPRLTAAYACAASASARLSHDKMQTARDSSAASVVEIEPNISAVNTDSLRLISEALILSTGSPHAPIALANTNTEFRSMMRPVQSTKLSLAFETTGTSVFTSTSTALCANRSDTTHGPELGAGWASRRASATSRRSRSQA